jgi:hypothetical protein
MQDGMILYMTKDTEETGIPTETVTVKEKFSWCKFFIKLTSRAFWVWLITTGIVAYVIYRIFEKENPPAFTWMAMLLGIWGGTAALFVGGNVLIDAMSKAVEKAAITFNTNVNANANTSISGAAGGSAASTASDARRKGK